MRFSKTFWLILTAGVFVIALAAVYLLYLQEERGQEPLNEGLAAAQEELPKLASERTNLENTLTDMEDELAQATSQLETAQAAFPAAVESIEVDELLFGIAHDWELEIASLTASEPSDLGVVVEVETEDIEVEDITYLVTSFTIVIKGERPESVFGTEAEHKTYIYQTVDDILKFINTVATHDDFTTATMKLVTITVPVPLTEEELEDMEEIADAQIPSATIALTIYSYEGE